ncbi:MAG: PAS domain S-box protein, partial [Candidatus Cloacimonetes bacterium]|nr:PAS domain S-box protein [Candidatus Cloacimonadota bacterium]
NLQVLWENLDLSIFIPGCNCRYTEIAIQTDKPSILQMFINIPFIQSMILFFRNLLEKIGQMIFENKSIFGAIILLVIFIFLFLIILSNIAKRKRIEKNITREYHKIDQRVEECTRKLRLSNQTLMEEIENLKENERYLLQIKHCVDNMELGVIITDTFGKILYSNKANARMHGYAVEELIGKYANIFTSNVLREELNVDAYREWQGKVRKSSNIRKDGSVFPVQLISDLVTNNKGDVTAVVTTCEDISERMKAEQALKDNEENYRRIFENIQDVYYEVDIDGIIKEISPSVNTIANYSRQELLGKPMNDIYADIQQRDIFLKALKKDEKVHDYEIYLKGKDNVTIPCSVTAKLILDDSGLPAKIIGSLRNITERKKIEEEQLRTLKELTAANKELRDFAYVTSHDLKSPLRAINTLANWISLDYSDKFDDNGREQMNLLLGRVDRMHQLIEGIFQYSSLGSYQGKIEDVDLDELVSKVIEKLNIPHEMSVKIDHQLPVIYYERERIEQVFQHLIKNAVQFMNKPNGNINIGYQEKDMFFEFYVSDNGPGIEKRHFERIFDMFKTLQSRDDMESSGIGLTIVKKIVEMNNGKVWVESRYGKGSTFYFTVPRSKKIIKAAAEANK